MLCDYTHRVVHFLSYPEDWTGIRETDVIKAQHRYGNGMIPHMLTHAIHPIMVVNHKHEIH